MMREFSPQSKSRQGNIVRSWEALIRLYCGEFYPSFHLIWLLWPWMNFSWGSSLISLPTAARKGKGGRQAERKEVNELLGKIELISVRPTVQFLWSFIFQNKAAERQMFEGETRTKQFSVINSRLSENILLTFAEIHSSKRVPGNCCLGTVPPDNSLQLFCYRLSFTPERIIITLLE